MLSTADLVLLAIVGISAIVGLWRGFVVEVMSLAVWIAAFWLAFAFGDEIAALFEQAVQAAGARLFLGYAITFIAALLAGGLATWLMGKLVRSTGLSGTDRVLGLGFGLLRGAALACVLVLLFGFTPLPQDAWWRESRLMPGFQRGAEWLRSWLPDAVARHVTFQLPALPVPPRSPPDPDKSDNSGAPPRG
jgi:membrane protein required for colicin V production